MNTIVWPMSRQVLGVTFPLSEQRQSASLLNGACWQQLTLFSRKNLSKCARDPSRQPSPRTTCWYSHELSLSALTGSIPEKYFPLKSKVFFLPDLIFPCSSCSPRCRSNCFSLVVSQKRSSFSYMAENWDTWIPRSGCEDLWTGAVSLGRMQVGWVSL